MIFRKLGALSYKAAEYFVMGSVLNKKTGARFLKPDEYQHFLSPKNKGLLIDGQKLRLSTTESFQNVCLSARVGAGKTTKYIIPNVMDKATQQVSMVIHDPKGEVHQLTSGYLKANGYQVIVFDPKNVASSYRFNPCAEASNAIEIELIAHTLIWSGNPNPKEPYWNYGAARLVSVLLKCLSYGDPKYFNLPNLYHLLQNFGMMGAGLDGWIARNCWDPKRPDDETTLTEWRGVLTGNQEGIQSYIVHCVDRAIVDDQSRYASLL